jgi:hypothetical protein
VNVRLRPISPANHRIGTDLYLVKRRTKQRETQKKKAEKAATTELPTHSKAKAKEPSEDDLNPNV